MAFDAGTLFYSVDARTEGLLTAERQVDSSTRRMERSLGNVEKATDKLSRSTDNAVSSLGNLKPIVTAVASALATQRVIAYADAWTNLQNQLRQVTDTEQDRIRVTQQLMDIANDTRSGIESTANLYARLTRASSDLGLSEQRRLQITKTINQAMATSGATAQEAESAIVQLSQALASGALRGEEFNAIADASPPIMEALRKELNMTQGELRAFAAEGGITAETVIKALEGISAEMDSRFAKAAASFGQSMKTANNNLTEFIGTSGAVSTTVNAAGQTIVFFSEYLDDIAKVAGLAATVIGVRLVQSLTLSAARMAANAVGAGTLTAAYSTMGARAATTAIAVRGLSAAMATLGGPVGVAILAATAVYQFRDSLFGATDRAAKLSARVRELTGETKNLTRAQIDNNIANFGGTLAELSVKADEARKKVQQAQAALNQNNLGNSGALGVSGVNISGYSEAQQDLAKITNEISAYKQAISELEDRKKTINSTDQSTTPTVSNISGNADGAADNAAKETARLQQELESRRRMVEQSLATESEAAYREYQERNLEIQTLYEDGSAQQQQLLERNNAAYAAKVAEMNQVELDAETQHQAAMLQAQRDSYALRLQELTGFSEQAVAKLLEIQQNAADPAKYLTESLGEAFVNLDDTISQTFTNGIRQGESFGNIMADVGRSIVADLLQSIIKLGVQMAINAALGNTYAAASAATAAATGASMAAAYAPAAAMASLASFGANAIPAAAALTSTTALASTMALAGGRQYGGGVTAGNAYRVTEDGKPEMFTSGTQSYLLPGRNGKVTSNNDLTSGASGGMSVQVNLYGQAAAGAQVTQSEGVDRQQIIDIILDDSYNNGPIRQSYGV